MTARCKPLTAEERARIIKMYRDGNKSMRAIANELCISPSAIWRVINNPGNTTLPQRSCPGCKSVLPNVANMSYCPFCAFDISTPSQRTVKALKTMLNYISKFYPAEHRDFAVKTLNNAIDLLNNKT